MKLYVAERHYDYEGFVIIGIFDTRDAAQNAVDNDIYDSNKRPRGDFHDIEELILNELAVY